MKAGRKGRPPGRFPFLPSIGLPRILLFVVPFLRLPDSLLSKEIRVPADAATIRSAVLAARDGDTVVVSDGIYLEDNIVIDKAIGVKAEHAFGAVIYGSQLHFRAVFIVRAAARIEGFVIKNAYAGIMQRGSPDVEWTGRDLAFLGIQQAAVDINDASKNVGRGRLSNIIVDRSGRGFSTNDAHGLEVTGALVTDSRLAFVGANHLYFRADRTVVVNCEKLSDVPDTDYPHDGIHEVAIGREVLRPDAEALSKVDTGTIEGVLFRFFPKSPASSPEGKVRGRFFSWFASLKLGDIHLAQGRYRQAREAYGRALSIARSMNLDFVPRACFGIARVAELAGDDAAAVDYYRRAIVAVEDLKARLPLRIFREGFLLDKLEFYDRALALLYRLHTADPGQTYGRMALRLLERVRSGGSLDSLWRLRAEIRTPRAPDHQSREQEISRRINGIQAGLEEPSRDRADVAALSVRLEEAEAESNALLSELMPKAMEAGRPGSPETSSLVRDIAESEIAPDTGMVVYAVGPAHTYALLVTAAGLRFVRIGETKDVRALVENYLAFLQDGPDDKFKGAAGGRRLYDVLLGPALDPRDKTLRKLVIIPDDILWYLPFEALVVGGQGRYLIEDFEISYSPSITYLLNLADRPSRDAAPMDLLAVANEEGRSLPGLLRNTTLRLPPLRFAAMEALNISRFFPRERRTVLVNEQVSEDSFKRLPLADYRIIHLATHGFLDDDTWWRSALLLRRGPDPSGDGPLRDDDGLIQAFELLGLTLRVDLVVLSACQTAMGQLFRGDGVVGMSGAFMAAGARSVLSSLWSVNDKSTARLMDAFYRGLTEGKTKAEALRLSKLKMLGSSYRHPYHWAAFVLSGESGTSIPVGRGRKGPSLPR